MLSKGEPSNRTGGEPWGARGIMTTPSPSAGPGLGVDTWNQKYQICAGVWRETSEKRLENIFLLSKNKMIWKESLLLPSHPAFEGSLVRACVQRYRDGSQPEEWQREVGGAGPTAQNPSP